MYIKGLEPDFVPVDVPIEYQIQEKQELLAQLISTLGANHESVISLKKEIDNLKNS